MKVYATDICIDCRNLKHVLKLRGITLETIDITANTANLREFLHLRDTHPIFARCRELGGIGVPCFVDGDFVSFSENEALARLGQEPIREDEILEHRI